MPDVRLIDANALIKQIEETHCKDCNSYNGVMCRACEWMDAMDYIEDAPTIDAQPVKCGRWELCIERFMTNIYACSVCRSKLGIPSDLVPESFYCYCPRCGARMEG